MIMVTIDMLSGGIVRRRKTVATMRIGNITTLSNISDYVVEGREVADPFSGADLRSARALVKGHDRRQHMWSLIAKAAGALAGADFEEQ